MDDWEELEYEDDYSIDAEWSGEYYDQSDGASQTGDDANYKAGKGKKGKKGSSKGKQPSGQQCAKCGSRMHSEDHCPSNSGSGSAGKGKSDSHYQEPSEYYDEEPVDTFYDWDSDETYDAYDVWIEDAQNGNYWQRRWFRRKGKGKGRKGKRPKGGKGKGSRGRGPSFPRSPFRRNGPGKGGKSSSKGKRRGKSKSKGKRRKGAHYEDEGDGIHLASSFAGMLGQVEEEEEGHGNNEYEEEDVAEQATVSVAEAVGLVPSSVGGSDATEDKKKDKPKTDAFAAIFGTPKPRSAGSSLGLSAVWNTASGKARPKPSSLGLVDSVLYTPPPGLPTPTTSQLSTGVMLPPAPITAPQSWSSNEAPQHLITPIATPTAKAVAKAMTPPPGGADATSPAEERLQEELLCLEISQYNSEARLLEDSVEQSNPQGEETAEEGLGGTAESTEQTPDDWTHLRMCPTCYDVGDWSFVCECCNARYCSTKCFQTTDEQTALTWTGIEQRQFCPRCVSANPLGAPNSPADMSSSVSSSTSYYNLGAFFIQHSYGTDATCALVNFPDNEFERTMKDEGCDYRPEDEEFASAEPTNCVFLFGTFNSEHSYHSKIFTSVGGVDQVGLLIDPGASKALIGMDTLKKIMDKVLKPLGMAKNMRWCRSTATFQGINPKAEHSLGVVTFPIGLTGMSGCVFKADVIGGISTLCPGLVPLRTLASLHAVIMCGHYSNGDGVLGLWHQGCWKPQHLFRTDSGHYLLRVDNFRKMLNSAEQKAVIKTTSSLAKVAPVENTVSLHSSSWYGTSNQGAWNSNQGAWSQSSSENQTHDNSSKTVFR